MVVTTRSGQTLIKDLYVHLNFGAGSEIGMLDLAFRCQFDWLGQARRRN